MKIRITQSIFIIAFLIATACDNYDVPQSIHPVVKTLPVKAVDKSGFLLEAHITKTTEKEIINYGFVWGIRTKPLKDDDFTVYLGNQAAQNKYTYLIESGLGNEKLYNVRSFVTTSTHTIYGNIETLKSNSVDFSQ
jgi:hypothetical protein